MKRGILKKLASQAGESIGETLVALLISALALMMLAGAVTSAMRIVTNSKAKLDDYYTVSNAMVNRKDASPLDSTSITGDLTVSISGLTSADSTDIEAKYWKNETLSGTPVITYSKSDT